MVIGAVGLPDREFAECVVSGNGTSAADFEPAGDSGVCFEPDLAAGRIGNGSGGARVEQTRDPVGATDDCNPAGGFGAAAGISARFMFGL